MSFHQQGVKNSTFSNISYLHPIYNACIVLISMLVWTLTPWELTVKYHTEWEGLFTNIKIAAHMYGIVNNKVKILENFIEKVFFPNIILTILTVFLF